MSSPQLCLKHYSKSFLDVEYLVHLLVKLKIQDTHFNQQNWGACFSWLKKASFGHLSLKMWTAIPSNKLGGGYRSWDDWNVSSSVNSHLNSGSIKNCSNNFLNFLQQTLGSNLKVLVSFHNGKFEKQMMMEKFRCIDGRKGLGRQNLNFGNNFSLKNQILRKICQLLLESHQIG